MDTAGWTTSPQQIWRCTATPTAWGAYELQGAVILRATVQDHQDGPIRPPVTVIGGRTSKDPSKSSKATVRVACLRLTDWS